MIYVFPLIPCVINFFLALITSGIFVGARHKYDECKDNLKDGEKCDLDLYLGG